LESLAEKLGIAPGETTSDGKVTLEFGECLGLCDYAPAMLANETVYKNMTADQAGALATQLKQQADGR
jgi:NADH-quinone oxidoreductase subunit E